MWWKNLKANFPYVDFRIALTLHWKSIWRYVLAFQMRIVCVSFSSQEALLASTEWTWAQLHPETRNKSKNLNECHYFQKFTLIWRKKRIASKKFQRTYLVLNYASFWETLMYCTFLQVWYLKVWNCMQDSYFYFLVSCRSHCCRVSQISAARPHFGSTQQIRHTYAGF